VRSKQEENKLESWTKPQRLAPTVNFIKNNIDVETAEKNQVVKAAKTKQNAESKLAINTGAHILEIYNKFARCQ
jgi:hypothetical protein